jgi:uncharacterized protein YvpB
LHRLSIQTTKKTFGVITMDKEKYITVVEAYDKQLVKMVNEKMKEGYEPHGNVVIAFNETGAIKSYVQIMMLKER